MLIKMVEMEWTLKLIGLEVKCEIFHRIYKFRIMLELLELKEVIIMRNCLFLKNE